MKSPSPSDRAKHFRIWQLRKQYPNATKESVASEMQLPVWEIVRIMKLFGSSWGTPRRDSYNEGVRISAISTDAYMNMRPEYRPC